MSLGNENLICGPLVPWEVRQSVGWQSLPYTRFNYTVNALKSIAHVIGFDIRPLYLQSGSDLDDTNKELSRRLIAEAYRSLIPREEIPERRKFFMRLIGRDPDRPIYAITFPSRYEASRGAAAKSWAVTASDGAAVLQAAEKLLETAGPNAESLLDMLRRESPTFSEEKALEAIQASIIRPSGYLQRLLLVARASAEHNTYFLSWWV